MATSESTSSSKNNNNNNNTNQSTPPTTTPPSTTTTPFLIALVSGGLAGTCVDIALFPIDTIKTRLQSPQGFLKAGGFHGIYRGLGAAALGSAPGAALFFSTYEAMKPYCIEKQHQYQFYPSNPAFSHMISASIGEAAACLVRVPTEVIKSTMQTNAKGSQTVLSTIQLILAQKPTSTSTSSGSGSSFLISKYFGGLYRGYGITLLREVPFALIQFPIYEQCKIWLSNYYHHQDNNNNEITSLEAAACGSFGGAIAAATTTPLDVLKTRLMLGKDSKGVVYKNAFDVMNRSIHEEGIRSLFRGIQPRVMWISIGGFVFFGAYEFARSTLLSLSTSI